ncbi:hypothetical protein [Saccharibacillus endophyticus]|uniref:Uncharacterized protein n=1 Tax=Saccharibacillus endophyticus TaxID=2060666 RepID=A0ABQ1ZMP5_9BACL|nr:hypothetical protein [Saccharibacillus endophyticus]GGH71770.1 hypothetical protein GCM10007362_09200 [Saccharibacillus endophyticus]
MRSMRELPTPSAEETPLLQDHRLERWLSSARQSDTTRKSDGGYHWTQRVQYAVGHAVNRYYSVEPELRRHADTGELVDYRWPRRISYFDSEKSYWELKDRVARHLKSFFISDGYEGHRPVMLYEQFETHVPDLGIDLSMIFQVVWQSEDGQGIHLQKFAVDDDPEVLDGYRHAARVFCRHAFGTDPAKIEVCSVLDGERICLSLDDVPYEKSLDYLRLAHSGMEETNSGQTCACGRCKQDAVESAAAFRLS